RYWPSGDQFGASNSACVCQTTRCSRVRMLKTSMELRSAAMPLPVAEAVGDRVTAVTPEVLAGDLYTRRRLPPLVFGKVKQMLDPLHGRHVVPACHELLRAHLELHQAFEDVVEHRIWRQRILVRLVRAKLGGGCLA